MATIPMYNADREAVGEVELADAIFGVEVKPHLLHLAVRKQQAAARQGTHKVKERSEVSGGGRKPWKQKGTGRARAGSNRSPIWRGGGIVHGPRPRSYDFKVNKREMRAALCSALALRLSEGKLTVIDELAFETPKSKNTINLMKRFELGDMLLVDSGLNHNVELSMRNLQGVTVLPPVGVNVYDVLLRDNLVFTRAGLEAITARLGGEQ